MYKRSLIIVVCVLFIVGLLFAPFSTPARAIVGVDDALAGGLFMAFFEAMGLSFSFTGIEQTKEGLIEFIQDQYDLYCIHKGVVATLISDAWSSLTDSIFSGGTIKIPREAAQDMGDFAEWMTEEYELTDNDSASIISNSGYSYSLDGITSSPLIFASGTNVSGATSFQIGDTFFINSNTLLISDPNNNRIYIYKNGDLVTSVGHSGTLSYYYFSTSDGQPQVSENVHLLFYNSNNQLKFNTAPAVSYGTLFGSPANEGVDINSDVIGLPGEIPEDDDIYITVPGVTDVFGGTVEGAADQILTEALEGDLSSSYEMSDTAPTYPDPSGPTATNIYGITFPSSPFGGIWHYVTELVEAVSGYVLAITSVWAILPSALMLPLYAGTVLVLVLGGFKVFRGVH